MKPFDPEFPETFEWASLDSRVGSELGDRLAREVRVLLPHFPEYMDNVPGLREALRALADVLEVPRA